MQVSPDGAWNSSDTSDASRNTLTQQAAQPVDASAEPDEHDQEPLGSVRIARRVLRTVVEAAALQVPGVARLAVNASQLPQLFGRPLPHHGVAVAVQGEAVAVDLYLVAEPGVNLVRAGSAVQEAVGAAIEHILGMHVSAINVYIQDVA